MADVWAERWRAVYEAMANFDADPEALRAAEARRVGVPVAAELVAAVVAMVSGRPRDSDAVTAARRLFRLTVYDLRGRTEWQDDVGRAMVDAHAAAAPDSDLRAVLGLLLFPLASPATVSHAAATGAQASAFPVMLRAYGRRARSQQVFQHLMRAGVVELVEFYLQSYPRHAACADDVLLALRGARPAEMAPLVLERLGGMPAFLELDGGRLATGSLTSTTALAEFVRLGGRLWVDDLAWLTRPVGSLCHRDANLQRRSGVLLHKAARAGASVGALPPLAGWGTPRSRTVDGWIEANDKRALGVLFHLLGGPGRVAVNHPYARAVRSRQLRRWARAAAVMGLLDARLPQAVRRCVIEFVVGPSLVVAKAPRRPRLKELRRRNRVQ